VDNAAVFGAADTHTAIDSRRARSQGDGSFSTYSHQGLRTVAKPELGTKRLCASCGAKFYDLNKTPINCPKCGTVFEITATAPRSRPDAAAAARAAATREAAPEAPEPQEAELVTLEEADAEAQGGGKKAPVADAEPGDDDVEIDETLGDDDDDAAFIPEEEEEDTDVTEIIGGDIEGDKDET
jgi:uncharacterized protein (TIGR02300 family)